MTFLPLIKSSKLFFAVFLIVLFPFHLFAWGHRGHQIVAELAMRQLSPDIRQKVQQVLGTMTPAEAGTWMDDVRDNAAYKYTAPWHYTNIEEGQNYKPVANGDIITALNAAYAELQYTATLSPERLRFNVLVLFHLCGDLTQPLHVGYGSDKGGNTYQVQYNGKGTNLHHIWDSEIIENENITTERLTSDSLVQNPDESRFETLRKQRIDFMYQMEASRKLTPFIYSIKGHKIDEAYMQKAGEIVHDQLFSGGFLLASCLEQLFSEAQNIPIEKAINNLNSQAKADTVIQELLPKVPAEQAANYIGKKVSICGKVYSTKFQGSGVTFINMEGEYPNNPFTAVIMANNRSNFNYKPEEYLNGKNICVTGTVKEYKGNSEIIIEKESQIRVQ